ncbi:MAG: hypothetical protein ACWA5R_03845 [bacterium]
MTEKTNIELFDEITAKVFAKLYTQFPVATGVDCLDVADCQQVDDFGKPTREAEICVSTLRWLADEGFIKVQAFTQFGGTGIVLTSQGLTKLKAVPDSVESKQTIGERLQVAVSAGAIPAAIEVLKLFFAS